MADGARQRFVSCNPWQDELANAQGPGGLRARELHQDPTNLASRRLSMTRLAHLHPLENVAGSALGPRTAFGAHCLA